LRPRQAIGTDTGITSMKVCGPWLAVRAAAPSAGTASV
jgi:hypothetical protein